MGRANLDEIEIQFEGNELFKYNRGFRHDNGRDFFQIQYLIRSFFRNYLSYRLWFGKGVIMELPTDFVVVVIVAVLG